MSSSPIWRASRAGTSAASPPSTYLSPSTINGSNTPGTAMLAAMMRTRSPSSNTWHSPLGKRTALMYMGMARSAKDLPSHSVCTALTRVSAWLTAMPVAARVYSMVWRAAAVSTESQDWSSISAPSMTGRFSPAKAGERRNSVTRSMTRPASGCSAYMVPNRAPMLLPMMARGRSSCSSSTSRRTCTT